MSGYIGDINNKAKKIKSLYIGDVNNKARKVKSAYIGVGVNGLARKWYSGEYESINIGTWSSVDDVNNFFTMHTPQNGWVGLKLGNYVTIIDGAFNSQWVIAGFNCEHNQTAADGTTYDNGYGICMIPRTVFLGKWNDTTTVASSYKSSYMNTLYLPKFARDLKNILGDHLVQRNVLLSSECNSGLPYHDKIASAYEWTTAYCTLMPVGQLTGTFRQNCNKYDDGEANYKLPLFNFTFDYPSDIWTRCVSGFMMSGDFTAWAANSINGSSIGTSVTRDLGVRPLIYLR